MNKKERVIAAIQGKEVDAIPCGFSIHFPKNLAFGEMGIESHLKFFRETDTDILKIMNENLLPDVGDIRCAEDWKKIPHYTLETPFLAKQIEFVQRILDKCGDEGFTLGTLHGICACAIHPIENRYGYEQVRKMLCTHFRENKMVVLDAFKRITEAMCLLAQKYVDIGLDGVYYAALGGEKHYYTDEEFALCIEPFDKEILNVVKEAGGYTFLHICKENLNMERYISYNKYADVVNWGVFEAPYSLEEGKKLFPETTIMGGLANRKGVLIEGSIETLQEEVKKLIEKHGPRKYILGADCTLPTEISYERIKAVVDVARKKEKI